jgi:hypothetical protein
MSPAIAAAWAFVALGAACVIVALVVFVRGGSLSGPNAEVKVGPFAFHSIVQPIVLAIVGLLALAVAGGFASADGDDGQSDPSTTTASTTSTSGSQTTTASTSATSGGQTATTVVATTSVGSAGCAITTQNPLATIHEQPDTFSPEIVKVPPGTYPVTEFRAGAFGSRWLKVSVADRSGWLEDSTFNVETKSAGCP